MTSMRRTRSVWTSTVFKSEGFSAINLVVQCKFDGGRNYGGFSLIHGSWYKLYRADTSGAVKIYTYKNTSIVTLQFEAVAPQYWTGPLYSALMVTGEL